MAEKSPEFKKYLDILGEDVKRSAGPDYENNIRTKFPGYNLMLTFPTIPSEFKDKKYLIFPAYIDQVQDSFDISYNPQEVYGRMDPIPIYQRTQRSVTFDLKLPSFGLEQSREISRKLNILVQNLYPTYQKYGNVNVISSPPLVRVGFSNLLYDSATNNSLLGYFSTGVDITHELKDGVFARADGYEVYAKYYSLSFTLNVLHEYTPGFVSSDNALVSPVNILGGLNPTFKIG